MFEAQNQGMDHLAKSISFCPRVILTKAGEKIGTTQSGDGENHFVRLVTYLPGAPLGTVKFHSPALLYDLGNKIGHLAKA